MKKKTIAALAAGGALLLAAVTALVDALPVFGTGTVLLPWAAVCLLAGQAPRAVALAALYAVISAVRSLLEPKVMAAQAGTIPYELTCAVSKRVPRVYLQGGKVVEKELLLRM